LPQRLDRRLGPKVLNEPEYAVRNQDQQDQDRVRGVRLRPRKESDSQRQQRCGKQQPDEQVLELGREELEW